MHANKACLDPSARVSVKQGAAGDAVTLLEIAGEPASTDKLAEPLSEPGVQSVA
jgi:hypothetical protein